MIKPHFRLLAGLLSLAWLPIPLSAQNGHGGYGLLWLETDPNACDIALDGRVLDVSVWLISVPPGEHDLLVRKSGFKPFENRIQIEADSSMHLQIRLDSLSIP